jgi:hypothetical protein
VQARRNYNRAKSGKEDGMGNHTHVLAGKIFPLPLIVGEQSMPNFAEICHVPQYMPKVSEISETPLHRCSLAILLTLPTFLSVRPGDAISTRSQIQPNFPAVGISKTSHKYVFFPRHFHRKLFRDSNAFPMQCSRTRNKI